VIPLRFPERGYVDLLSRRRLKAAIAKLALAIANGEVTPLPLELQALAEICETENLPIEAARVRRWMAGYRL
jgi:hypothetical protein